MKLKYALGVAALLCASVSYGDTIADWTFETSLPTTAGPFAAEIGSGSASGHHAGTSTYSSPAGNGSSHSFSSNVWAVGDYYEFSVSTTGLENISVEFDQTSSNTGPKDFNFQYSTDNSSFTTFASYSVLANAAPNPAWNATTSSSLYTITENLSTITALNNATTIYIRLTDKDTTSANGGTVATAGTDRVDNVIITGDKIPVVPLPAASTGGLILAGLLAARRRS
ncbi:MAG TPA: hypothetical protein VG722_07510 [Tepidisphaeraceae bacterium]|nr:hypothetical protein [Tepidisphaeraceae bacterium]